MINVGIRVGYTSANQKFSTAYTRITVVIDHGITTRHPVAELDEARQGNVDVLCPLTRLVQVLQLQHLRGIHTYEVEASNARLLGPRVQHRREEWRLGMI